MGRIVAAGFLLLALAAGAAFGGGGRKFVQLSDLHMDPEYSDRGDESRMCHFHNGTATRYGSYRCDSPKMLVESAILKMRQTVPDPDFILWTGDSSVHKAAIRPETVMRNLKFVTKELSNHFPGTPVIPVLGNHDSSPPDYFPVATKEASKPYADYITEGSLGDFLKAGSEAAEKFKKCGYYVVRDKDLYADDGRVTQTFIGLNTNLYDSNKAVQGKPLDPCGQLEWLDRELKASADDERVFIVAHVPPGFFEHAPYRPFFENEDTTRRFVDIVTDKSNAKKIVAHFYGHTHTDSFRLFMDSENVPVGVAFIAPSVTPLIGVRHGVNPSFRVYDYDPIGGKILSYSQYYLPLDEVIKTQNENEENDESDESDQTDRRMRNSKFLRSKREAEDDGGNSTESQPSATVASGNGENATETESVTLVTEDATAATETDVSDSATSVTTAGPTVSSDGRNVTLVTPSVTSPPGNVTPTTQPATTVTAYEERLGMDSDDDADVRYLLSRWQFGYNAGLDYDAPALDIANVYRIYGDMRDRPSGQRFKYFMRHAFVLREHSDALECDDLCHARIICSLTHMVSTDLNGCIRNMTVVATVDPTTAATTTSSTSTTPVIHPDSNAGKSSDEPRRHFVRGLAIGMSLVVLLGMAVAALTWYNKQRRRRYCSQEFLLDSFRYDGYSQLDQPI